MPKKPPMIMHGLRGIPDRHGQELKRILEELAQPGWNCLDVGSAYGWASWCLLKRIGRTGKVTAWEPNPYLVSEHTSKWPFTNYQCIQEAVSNRTGPGTLWCHAMHGEGSGYNSLNPTIGGALKIPVQCQQLDTWWESQHRPWVDLIKIDTEGHELEVIEGAQKLINHCHPIMVVEQKDHHRRELWQDDQGQTQTVMEQAVPAVRQLLEKIGYCDCIDISSQSDTVWQKK